MDPRITGGVIYTETDRPFIEVIDRIAELGSLRYEFRNNSLKIEIDEPYIDYYRLDYPDITRSASSTSQTTTDVSNAIQGASGGSGTSQSDVSVSSSTDSNFWASVGEGIQQILAATNTRTSNSAEQSQAFVPTTTETEETPAATDETSDTQSLVESVSGQPGLENPLLAGTSAGSAPSGQGQPTQAAAIDSSFYSMNQQAGIVTVFASKKQHLLIGRYTPLLKSRYVQFRVRLLSENLP